MAIQETIMRASIADITPIDRRGRAYGVFNTVYGMALLSGSLVIGLLYEAAVHLIIPYVAFIELIAHTTEGPPGAVLDIYVAFIELIAPSFFVLFVQRIKQGRHGVSSNHGSPKVN